MFLIERLLSKKHLDVNINLKIKTMKLFTLILSVSVFIISAYFFAADFKFSAEINHIIYMSMLMILMCICVIGMIINVSLIRLTRKKMSTLIYNEYSQKSLKPSQFERQFEIL